MEPDGNFGIGVDIEDVRRFEDLDPHEDAAFLEKIFTENELNYCFSKVSPGRHLSARFSGKEAVVKALNSIGKNSVVLKDIEILNNEKGVPKVEIKVYENLQVLISLSHSKDKSIAFAIVMEVNHDRD